MNRNHSLLASLVAAVLVPACAPSPSSSGHEDDNANSFSDADTSAIAWRASSVAALDQSTGPATSIVVATPAGTAKGDVEIAAIATYGSTTVTAPSGWALVKSQVDATTTVSASGVGTYVYSHVAGASEPANVSFAFSVKSRGVATVQSYVNVDPQSPIDAVASAAETTTRTAHTTPAITTSAAGDVLIGVFATVNPTEPASTTSTMAHERADRSCGNTGSWGIDLALYDSSPRASAGAESGRQAVSSSATDGATMTLLALRKKSTAVATLFGAAFNPHTDAYYTTLFDAWGGLQIDRTYDNGQGTPPYLSSYQSFDTTHDMVSNYSFKYLPTEVLAGSHDAAIHDFFAGIADGHLVYWTYWHEPDDEIYKDHTFTAPDYRAAWKHIRDIADAVKATRPNLQIQATFICMEYSMTPPIAPSRPLTGDNGMYPGDDVIDVFGVDAYNSGAKSGKITDAATEFGKVIDFAKAHGKPWGIGEFGSCPVAGNPSGRATWMDNALGYMADSDYPPLFIEWFNVDMSGGGGGACDFRMEGDAAAVSVYHQAMTQGLSSFE